MFLKLMKKRSLTNNIQKGFKISLANLKKRSDPGLPASPQGVRVQMAPLKYCSPICCGFNLHATMKQGQAQWQISLGNDYIGALSQWARRCTAFLALTCLATRSLAGQDCLFRVSKSDVNQRATIYCLSVCSRTSLSPPPLYVFVWCLPPHFELSDRAIERSNERSSGRAIERAIERSGDRTSDRVTDRASDRGIKRAIERSSDRANDRAIERSSDGKDMIVIRALEVHLTH